MKTMLSRAVSLLLVAGFLSDSVLAAGLSSQRFFAAESSQVQNTMLSAQALSAPELSGAIGRFLGIVRVRKTFRAFLEGRGSVRNPFYEQRQPALFNPVLGVVAGHGKTWGWRNPFVFSQAEGDGPGDIPIASRGGLPGGPAFSILQARAMWIDFSDTVDPQFVPRRYRMPSIWATGTRVENLRRLCDLFRNGPQAFEALLDEWQISVPSRDLKKIFRRLKTIRENPRSSVTLAGDNHKLLAELAIFSFDELELDKFHSPFSFNQGPNPTRFIELILERFGLRTEPSWSKDLSQATFRIEPPPLVADLVTLRFPDFGDNVRESRQALRRLREGIRKAHKNYVDQKILEEVENRLLERLENSGMALSASDEPIGSQETTIRLSYDPLRPIRRRMLHYAELGDPERLVLAKDILSLWDTVPLWRRSQRSDLIDILLQCVTTDLNAEHPLPYAIPRAKMMSEFVRSWSFSSRIKKIIAASPAVNAQHLAVVFLEDLHHMSVVTGIQSARKSIDDYYDPFLDMWKDQAASNSDPKVTPIAEHEGGTIPIKPDSAAASTDPPHGHSVPSIDGAA